MADSGLDVVQTVASTRADHGGPSRSVPHLCEALVEKGVSIRLVTAAPEAATGDEKAIRPQGPAESRIVRERGPLGRILRAPLAFPRVLYEEAARNRPDLLHDHGLWLPSNVSAALTVQSLNVPLVISTRGMLTDWALDHHRWKKRLAWWLYQRHILRGASLFHVTSEEEVEALRELGLDQPVAVIPNGVVLPEDDDGRSEESSVGDRRALFLSRLHPKKGLPMLIEAWARVRPEDWILELAGPAENGHRAELEELVMKHGLEEEVVFLGSVSDEDKWDVYRRSDLFVLPTHSENFGIVVAEALASGVPVLTTRGAPWSELERHRCGWWVEPELEPLAAGLRTATGCSDETRSRMGARGRALVEEKYAWSEVARKMRASYRWLLGEGSKPDCIRGASSTEKF